MLQKMRWLIVVLLLGVGVSYAQDDGVPTYTEGLIGQVSRLNPLLASLNPVDEAITALMFEGLTTINAYGEPMPLLAESWTVSRDGYEYVFKLREDVLWHDGEGFDVDDVIFTISLMQDANFPADEALHLFWRTVEVQPINNYLIRFRLAQPLASFPDVLRIGILPEHALRGTTGATLASHPFNLSPVGTGAYQLGAIGVEDGRIREVVLRVSPNFRIRPEVATQYAIERVIFRLFDDLDNLTAALSVGEIDGYAARNVGERPTLQQTPGLTIYQTFAPSVGVLIFNWSDDAPAFFRDVRVRGALAEGLDRSSLVERNLFDKAVRADSVFSPLNWAYNYGESLGMTWVYNPDRARSNMDTVLDRLTEDDAQTIEFSVLTLGDASLVAMVNEIAAQWQPLGVNATVEAVDLQTYTARLRSGDFDAALVEFSNAGSADPDVYAFWHQGQYPDGRNYGGVNSTSLSQALELARRDPNGINRLAHYTNFQRLFIEQAIAIPLYYPLYTYAMSPRVSGVQLGLLSDAADRFLTIDEWQVAE